uniref:Regulatory protein zeste n=1 Tax=Romanomermis culicivorax TaxID=13658 RepID=A0A915L5Q0_ROMCU
MECLGQVVNIIEIKGTDSTAIQAKKKAWDQIVDLFAKNPNCQKRSIRQLHDKWKKLKQVF